MFLSLLIILPLLTAVLLLFCSGLKQVRVMALSGAVVQLLYSFYILFSFWGQRVVDGTQMLFQEDHVWYAPLNIHYHVGIDGISVAMILLTAFVTVAGILVSWTMEKLSKEFFFLLTLLSMGA